MSRNNPRQRIRRQETRFRGKDKSFVFKNEEHSVFLNDGNIVSRQRFDSDVAQGIIPHSPDELKGQCQTCLNFLTEKTILICDLCWNVTCLPCAVKKDNMTVCPACAKYLEHRRRILIFRKLFIEPFIEWVR